jgi:hypothetical protein
VAVDATGNVYVADYGNNRVVKITPGGTQTTFASNVSTPRGIAVDGGANVYVTTGADSLVKLTPKGTQSTLATGFIYPSGVAVDAAGRVYVADVDGARVVEVAPNGTESTVGSGFTYPSGVALDSTGDLYVADYAQNAIVEVAPSGAQTTLGSNLGQSQGVAVDAAGRVYVADEGAGKVVEVAAQPRATSSAAGVATVSWAAPLFNGGSPVTGYSVTATDTTTPANGGQTCTPSPATSRKCTETGLTNGDRYTFAVTATNEVGSSAQSVPSNAVTPVGAPSAPQAVTAAGAGSGAVAIGWSAPVSTGGRPVTGYGVTATDTTTPANGGQTCTPSPATTTSCTVTGLTNGDRYTFTVTATNKVGTGAPSAPVSLPAPALTTVSPAQGPVNGGTTITLTGTGFVPGAAVVIAQGHGAGTGAIAATSVTVVSATQITAVTGGGATTGTRYVFVLTPGGTSAATAGATFTY